MHPSSLTICDTLIRTDAEGRYCLNDLHKAAGGEKKHGPSYWLANQQTSELIAELTNTGIPVLTQKGGSAPGTYVCKELVYAYAMWISPAFHLKVIRAYDALVTAPSATQVSDPRTAAMIEMLVKQDQLEQQQRQQAQEIALIQESVAVIEARTQPENKHFTVMGYARLQGTDVDLTRAAQIGRKCAALSREQGLAIGDVRDPRFGYVHTYHESVLAAVLASEAA